MCSKAVISEHKTKTLNAKLCQGFFVQKGFGSHPPAQIELNIV